MSHRKFSAIFVLVLILCSFSVLSYSLAYNKPVACSSEPDPGGGPCSWLTDEGSHPSEQWYSDDAQPQWAYVDLNASYSVDNVSIEHSSSGSTYITQDYTIQYTDDDSAGPWTIYYRVVGNAAINVSHENGTVSARYWSINTTDGGDADSRTRLREIRVWQAVAGAKVALNSPADGDNNNVQLQVDYNNTAGNTINVSLYINGTVNATHTNVASGSNNLLINSTGLEEGDWLWLLEACEGGDCENTTARTYTLDSTAPIISWNVPRYYIGINTSYDVFVNSELLPTNVTLLDDNLYSYYYNITYPNATLIANYSNTSLSPLSSYTITDQVNLSGITGQLNSTVKVCDAHTANRINNFVTTINDKELNFDPNKENVLIVPLNKNAIQTVDTFKLSDRYQFYYETNNVDTLSFAVYSNQYLDIVEGSEYEGHLITGNKWIDFEISDVKTVTTNRVSDNLVMVTVERNAKHTDWLFNSVGELNCNTEERIFYVTDTTEAYTEKTLTTNTNTFQLNLTYDAAYMFSMDATLYYNNTAYTPTVSSSGGVYTFTTSVPAPLVTADVNKTFYWNYQINGRVDKNTTSKTQEVYAPKIDACGTYTQPFVNYTLKDELNSTVLTGDIEYIFEVQHNTYNFNYNASETGASSFDFCLYPAWANFTTDIDVQYSVTGYETRDYVQQLYTVDNFTEQVSLYALESGVSSSILIHVKDDSDKDLVNVLVETYRYDIATNSDILVESETTDSDGNVEMNLKTGSEYYSFRFYQDGELQLTTSRFKLFATEYEYVLYSVTSSPIAEWLHLNSNVQKTLTYDSTNNVVNFSWTYGGSEVTEFCLNIQGNGTTWYNTCSTDVAAGSLNYTINTFNVSYMAYGQATMSSGSKYAIIDLSIDTRVKLKDIFGDGLSLFITIIVFLTITLLALWNKSVAVVAGSIALIFLWIFNVLPIGIGTLMGLITISVIMMMLMERRK